MKKSTKKINCFVSYSRSDINIAELNALLNWMNYLSGSVFKFYFDFNLIPGDNLKEFIDEIENVDCIFVFCSPGYKDKIELNKIASGVFKEYTKIVYINERNQNLKLNFNNNYTKYRIPIYPFLIKGDVDSSIPIELTELLHLDIKNIRFLKRESILELNNTSKNIYKDPLMKIITNIITLMEMKDPDFNNKEKELLNEFFIEKEEIKASGFDSIKDPLLKDIVEDSQIEKKEPQILLNELFVETKAEYTRNLPDSVIVKTKSYLSVLCQESYFLIGRKGSGKSTVSTTLGKLNIKKYKGIIRIFADEFDLQKTYEMFLTNENDYIVKVKDDIRTILTLDQVLEVFWESYIYLFSLYIIYNEREYLNEKQKKYFGSIQTFFLEFLINKNVKDLANPRYISKVFYSHCLENLYAFINIIIDKSRNVEKHLFTDIVAAFTTNNFIEFLIGKNIINDFYEIIKECNRHILISLDGFDRKFEAFRNFTQTNYTSESTEYKKRNSFETLWLISLLDILYLNKQECNMFFNIVDLCITIPMDRFLDLQNNRDFYKFRNRVVSLNWSGIELAIMLRKRLENLLKIKTEKAIPEIRLKKIFEEHFPFLPEYLEIKINNKIKNIELFQYVLRLSFWRPRDIIKYYTSILTLYNSHIIKKSGPINPESIKRVLKETSINIMRDEFISEFSGIFDNLSQIINKFRKCNQLLTYNKLYSLLNDLNLSKYSYNPESMKIQDKIQLLYNIGFLGIFLSKEYMEKYNITNPYAFIFNEGQMPMQSFLSGEFEECKFIIHCIFIEYLDLVVDSDDLVCNYDWKYLHDNEEQMHQMNIIPID